MSDSRPSNRKKSKKSGRKNTSNGLLLGGVVVALVIGLGAGAWVGLPKLFPHGVPGLSVMSRHVACLNEKQAAILARIELRGSIKDAASAKIAVPSLKRAYERETSANEAWAKLLKENPPSESDAAVLQEMFLHEVTRIAEVRNALDAAEIGMHSSVSDAISAELRVLSPELDQLNASVVKLNRAMEVILPKPEMSTVQVPVVLPSNQQTQPLSNPSVGNLFSDNSTIASNSQTPVPSASIDEPLSNSPPSELPAFEASPENDIRTRFGKKAVAVRILGLKSGGDLLFVANRVSPLTGGTSGTVNYTQQSTATAHFITVAPVDDITAFAEKRDPFGQVLNIDPEIGQIVLWIKPESLAEMVALPPGFVPFGPPGLPPGFPMGEPSQTPPRPSRN